MNKTPEIRFSSPQNPESWTPNVASHGGNIIACLTDADAKSAEGIFNELLERIRQYDHVIQAVATALGGVCCGGIDVDGAGSTKAVLVGAIESLHTQLAEEMRVNAILETHVDDARSNEYKAQRELAEKEAALAQCVEALKIARDFLTAEKKTILPWDMNSVPLNKIDEAIVKARDNK